MKTFLAVYVGTSAARQASDWDALGEDERREREQSGMQAWGEWMAAHDASITDAGGPLGKTKRVSAHGISDTSNDMVGYVVIRAESHEAAARKFENHPHFAIFPGECIDIMECLPIPGS